MGRAREGSGGGGVQARVLSGVGFGGGLEFGGRRESSSGRGRRGGGGGLRKGSEESWKLRGTDGPAAAFAGRQFPPSGRLPRPARSGREGIGRLELPLLTAAG
jgi:hypothetical protein